VYISAQNWVSRNWNSSAFTVDTPKFQRRCNRLAVLTDRQTDDRHYDR